MKRTPQSNASGNDRTTVLMYHAVDDASAPAADPHYSVSAATFAEQVGVIAVAGRRGSSVLEMLSSLNTDLNAESGPAVAITFDDGHASNRGAAEVLAKAGMTADFFVNPSTVGLAGFLGWSDLREMHNLGMSIQSHGLHHRYLSDITPAEVQQELVDSKASIEQQLGAPVTIFAPPGGRMPAQFSETAARAGYHAVCSSAVGYWQPAINAKDGQSSVQPKFQAEMIPRLAVLNATDATRFHRWISGHRPEMWKLQMRGALLQGAKRAVGNQRYDKLRQAIVGGPVS